MAYDDNGVHTPTLQCVWHCRHEHRRELMLPGDDKHDPSTHTICFDCGLGMCHHCGELYSAFTITETELTDTHALTGKPVS